MNPTLVVISSGNDGGYKHPRQVTLDKFTNMNSPPTVLQTNKYLQGGPGGNVADEFIADLMPAGHDGDINITVNPDGSYAAAYRSFNRPFQSIQRTAMSTPRVSIASLLPNPVADDRDLEEVELRNNSSEPMVLVGWFLRDQFGRVWSLTLLGQLSVGGSAIIRRNGMTMSLDNGGDKIELLDDSANLVDRFEYGATTEGARVAP
jgi:hypothetical protein